MNREKNDEFFSLLSKSTIINGYILFYIFLFLSCKEYFFMQFLWRNGGPRSEVHLIHSVWTNFQTSSGNVSD